MPPRKRNACAEGRREYDFHRAKRGPVLPVEKGKTRITIRLDNEVLSWFRSQVHAAGGGNYQKLINQARVNPYQCSKSRIAGPNDHSACTDCPTP
jgi:uncharacterized protein (DUF4415 family)